MTDFGLSDHYVGTMKAVLYSAVPRIQIIDLTHEIPAQDIAAGAFQLLSSYHYYPEGTLFLCVVDPAVGSERKILYAEAGAWRFIAPDNGLLSWVFDREPPRLLVDISKFQSRLVPVGSTFHGRDIMAPAAGSLLQGVEPKSLGPVVPSFASLAFPLVEKTGAMWTGQVIAIDRFGNLVSNIRFDDVSALADQSKVWIEFSGRPETIRGVAKSYSDVSPGKPVAVAGSSGFLEISIRDGNAAITLARKRGDSLTVHFRV